MLGIFRRLFLPQPPAAVDTAYIALVAAARNPFFFTALGVPDTLDGRFGLIVVHLFLLQYRLLGVTGAQHTENTEEKRLFAQWLSEEFLRDMDRSLRELGVGDTGVSHRIKKMGKAYHGCLQAYTAAINDEQRMGAALARNLYGTVGNGDVAMLMQMVRYITTTHALLLATDDTALLGGHYIWPEPAM